MRLQGVIAAFQDRQNAGRRLAAALAFFKS